MLFQSLTPMLKHTELMLQVSQNTENQITVIVIPKITDRQSNAALRQPISLTGQPAELDDCFAEQLLSLTTSWADLATMISNQKTVLETAKTAVATATAAAAQKRAAAEPVAAPVPPAGSDAPVAAITPEASTEMPLFEL